MLKYVHKQVSENCGGDNIIYSQSISILGRNNWHTLDPLELHRIVSQNLIHHNRFGAELKYDERIQQIYLSVSMLHEQEHCYTILVWSFILLELPCNSW